MNDQTSHRNPASDTYNSSGDSILTPGNLAVVGLAFAALAVLAFAGGTLNVTSSGVTMNVNPRS